MELIELTPEELTPEELTEINGGTANCKAQDGRSFMYYLGYGLGWFFD